MRNRFTIGLVASTALLLTLLFLSSSSVQSDYARSNAYGPILGQDTWDPSVFQPADRYLVRTTVHNGELVDEIVVPGRPPRDFRAPVVALPKVAPAGVVILPNVPAFDWCYGCSATAAAMMMGYYDNGSYPNMYTGPTNGGVVPMCNVPYWGSGECPLSATHQGKDGLAVRGHVDDYWRYFNNCDPDPYVGNWPEHTQCCCTADYMGTNQSKYSNCDGATTFYFYTNGNPLYDYTGGEPSIRDGCHGMRLFVESRGYTVTTNFSQYIYGYNGNTKGFTFAQFQQEIDAGRPVMIQVTGHSMVGYGYDDSNQLVYIHDTWDCSNHTMTWGDSYSGLQHYGVTVLRLQAVCNAPSITGQPSSQTRCVGQSVTFSVTATGTAPLGYQWRKGGSTISGATTSSYAISSVATSHAGNYNCVVTNSCGTATSNQASLTVTTPPGITQQPVGQTKCVGQDVTFSVTASGTAPLGYRWRKAGSGISGATTSSYSIESVSLDDAGSYDCVVSNACGSATSSAATLNVFECLTVAVAKQKADNQQVYLQAKSVTAAFPGFFYAEEDDRSCGIRVVKTAHGFSVGARVDIHGTVKTNDQGERYVDASWAAQNGTGSLAPWSLRNDAVGGADWYYDPISGAGQKGMTGVVGCNNIGLLIRTAGRVVEVGTDYFAIDDSDFLQFPPVRVLGTGLTLPSLGTYVGVTGISSCYKVGDSLYAMIIPRSQADIVTF